MKKSASKSSKFYYLIFGILAFGLLMVYNASPIYSLMVAGNSIHFARLQLVWTLFGVASFIAVSFLNFSFIKRISKIAFITSVVLLSFLAFFAVFFPCEKITPQTDIPFCPCRNGARRWVQLNPPPLPQIPLIGTLGFQASDFAKLAVILYLPALLESKLKTAKKKYYPFFFFFGYCLFTSFLIFLEPNMSNAGLVAIIGVAIYFISGADLKPLVVLVPAFVFVILIAVLASPYRRERLLTLVSPSQQSSLDESYQSQQILIGLGSGGAFGVGVGQSKQKQKYLPEVIGDSIFAIIGEEMGFLGSLIVIVIFVILSLEMLLISSAAVTIYEKMVGMGICAWVFFQYLINMYATIGIIPFTGMPIPFISYGGSSMVFTLAGLGLISNIHRRGSR